jgi:regulator of nucleoside diphosphate kinase
LIVKKHTPIVSDADYARLTALIESARLRASASERDLAALENELKRATIVPADKVPADVVTMNAVARVQDLDWKETETYTLVFPLEADISRNRISVLAPVGAALLGYREGDLIEWPVQGAVRRLRVKEVLYQPDRVAGVKKKKASDREKASTRVASSASRSGRRSRSDRSRTSPHERRPLTR